MRIVDPGTPSLPRAIPLFGVCLVLGTGCPDVLPVTDTDVTTNTEQTEGGTGDESGNWEPIPARGDIALTEVVVNQAVDVPIAVDGVWVGPADRNTYVVGNRDTLLRGFWVIPEDWQPRNITAVLELRYPDGTTDTLSDTKMIDGPSFAGDLDRGFVFPLIAEQFPPGLEYHMSLWEAEPGAEDERESTTIIESPIGGFELIGAQPEPAELKIVMMPVTYNTPGCTTDVANELTEAQEQTFIDFLHEQYPVQEVIWEYRRDTPIVVNEELNSLAQLWAPLQEQRIADNAGPNYYYYALINVCAGGIGDAAGIAPGLPPDTKAVASERVSSGVWIEGNESYSYHTMVHELGHNHGRAHVFCAGGDAAGTDPAYPYEDGIIGVWGFGIRLFKLHSPTATRDIMTYCSPNWVSDWGWSKVYNRIRTLTSWDYEGAPAGADEPEGEMLWGLIFEDGAEQWWTTPGAREPEHFSSGETIRFDYGDAVIESPTSVQILDDGSTMIRAAVPRPHVEFEAATRIDGGQARGIELLDAETRAWSLTTPASP